MAVSSAAEDAVTGLLRQAVQGLQANPDPGTLTAPGQLTFTDIGRVRLASDT